MKRENLKPSILTYYQTRASILHPILAITQVNIGIYLLFAGPYINTRFVTVNSTYLKSPIGCRSHVFQTSRVFHLASNVRDRDKENS